MTSNQTDAYIYTYIHRMTSNPTDAYIDRMTSNPTDAYMDRMTSNPTDACIYPYLSTKFNL